MAKQRHSVTPWARRSVLAGDTVWEVSSTVPGQTLPPRYAPEVYADWLFYFLRTDPARLSVDQRLAMRANAWAFARPELIDHWPKKRGLPSLTMLDAIKTAARAGVVRLRDGQEFWLGKRISYGIVRVGQRIMRVSRGPFPDLFLAAALDTLRTFWDRLRTCPTCGETFRKTGKRKFCSADCARRAHWAAYEKRHGDRDHHAEYLRRVQKRLGAKVQVRKRGSK